MPIVYVYVPILHEMPIVPQDVMREFKRVRADQLALEPGIQGLVSRVSGINRTPDRVMVSLTPVIGGKIRAEVMIKEEESRSEQTLDELESVLSEFLSGHYGVKVMVEARFLRKTFEPWSE